MWSGPRVLSCATGATAGVFLVAMGCSTPSGTPDPVGGGKEFVLDFDQFTSTVAPVLSSAGCTIAGDCHGGGIRGSYELTPEGARDLEFEFEQSVLQADPYDLPASPLLTKPLDENAGGTPHSFEPFASTGDPGYQTILAWLEKGYFEE